MRAIFTPTEQEMLKVLADGLAHTREELHACLPDELGSLSNIQIHISHIRQKINPRGQTIVCELQNRRIHYRQVRLMRAD